MSKTAPKSTNQTETHSAPPTPFKATDQVRVLKLGTMDPGKAIRKLRDK